MFPRCYAFLCQNRTFCLDFNLFEIISIIKILGIERKCFFSTNDSLIARMDNSMNYDAATQFKKSTCLKLGIEILFKIELQK